MPKRIVDGPGIWRSEKIRRIKPTWVRPEVANLIPLALANGTFEADPDRSWADVYSFNRPDIKPADVRTIFDSCEEVGLLFRWRDAGGKVWGFWVGIDKPGRLPGKSRRGKNEAIGPEPPEEQLRKFMDSNGIQKLPGSGLGSGLGSGKEGAPESGALMAQAKPRPSPFVFAGRHVQVTIRQDGALADAFPWVDRQAEFRKADSWCEANPSRRPKNCSRFLHSWFAKIPAPSSGAGGGNHAGISSTLRSIANA